MKTTVTKSLPLEIDFEYHPATEHSDSRVSLQMVSLGFSDITDALTSEQRTELEESVLAYHENEI